MNDSEKRAAKYGYSTVVMLVVTSFIPLSMALSCAGIFYPYVAADLGVSTGLMSYYVSFLWLSSTLFLSLLGRLLHRFDARYVITGACALIAATFVWLSFAGSLWQFYTGAFLMGLGVSVLLFLAPSTLINRWFAKRSGFLLGIVMAFTGVGGMVWNSVGGGLILSMGWSNTYRIFAVMSAAVAILAFFLIFNAPQDKGLLPIGFVRGEGTDGIDASAAAQGVPAAKAFKMPVFVLIIVMVFVLNFGMPMYFLIPSYVGGMEVSVAMPILGSLAASVAMAGQTVSKLVFGFFGDKYPHACVVAGLALGLCGVVLFALAPQSPAIICVAAFIFGVYYGITNVMSPILTRMNFGNLDYPKIYSRISTGAAIANMVAALVWGALLDVTGTYMVVFAGVGILLCVTAALVLAIKKASMPQG